MTFPDEDDRVPRSAEARWLRAALRGDDVERERVLREDLPDGPAVGVTVAACLLAARRLFDERWDRRVMPLAGITSRDVYLGCVCMVTIIFDWWDSDDAALSIMVRAEEMVEKKGHVLTR
jgi:hypothetical protein